MKQYTFVKEVYLFKSHWNSWETTNFTRLEFDTECQIEPKGSIIYGNIEIGCIHFTNIITDIKSNTTLTKVHLICENFYYNKKDKEIKLAEYNNYINKLKKIGFKEK